MSMHKMSIPILETAEPTRAFPIMRFKLTTHLLMWSFSLFNPITVACFFLESNYYWWTLTAGYIVELLAARLAEFNTISKTCFLRGICVAAAVAISYSYCTLLLPDQNLMYLRQTEFSQAHMNAYLCETYKGVCINLPEVIDIERELDFTEGVEVCSGEKAVTTITSQTRVGEYILTFSLDNFNGANTTECVKNSELSNFRITSFGLDWHALSYLRYTALLPRLALPGLTVEVLTILAPLTLFLSATDQDSQDVKYRLFLLLILLTSNTFNNYNKGYRYYWRTLFLKRSLEDKKSCFSICLSQISQNHKLKLVFNERHSYTSKRGVSIDMASKIYPYLPWPDVGMNIFSLSRMFFPANRLIWYGNFRQTLFDRQGYTKDESLFNVIYNNFSGVKRNLAKNLKRTPTLLEQKLNAYIFKHIELYDTGYTASFNIKLIVFNYDEHIKIATKMSTVRNIKKEVADNIETTTETVDVTAKKSLLVRRQNILESSQQTLISRSNPQHFPMKPSRVKPKARVSEPEAYTRTLLAKLQTDLKRMKVKMEKLLAKGKKSSARKIENRIADYKKRNMGIFNKKERRIICKSLEEEYSAPSNTTQETTACELTGRLRQHNMRQKRERTARMSRKVVCQQSVFVPRVSKYTQEVSKKTRIIFKPKEEINPQEHLETNPLSKYENLEILHSQAKVDPELHDQITAENFKGFLELKGIVLTRKHFNKQFNLLKKEVSKLQNTLKRSESRRKKKKSHDEDGYSSDDYLQDGDF